MCLPAGTRIPFFNLENNLQSNIDFTIKLQEAINQIIIQLLYSREAHSLWRLSISTSVFTNFTV